MSGVFFWWWRANVNHHSSQNTICRGPALFGRTWDGRRAGTWTLVLWCRCAAESFPPGHFSGGDPGRGISRVYHTGNPHLKGRSRRAAPWFEAVFNTPVREFQIARCTIHGRQPGAAYRDKELRRSILIIWGPMNFRPHTVPAGVDEGKGKKGRPAATAWSNKPRHLPSTSYALDVHREWGILGNRHRDTVTVRSTRTSWAGVAAVFRGRPAGAPRIYFSRHTQRFAEGGAWGRAGHRGRRARAGFCSRREGPPPSTPPAEEKKRRKKKEKEKKKRKEGRNTSSVANHERTRSNAQDPETPGRPCLRANGSDGSSPLPRKRSGRGSAGLVRVELVSLPTAFSDADVPGTPLASNAASLTLLCGTRRSRICWRNGDRGMDSERGANKGPMAAATRYLFFPSPRSGHSRNRLETALGNLRGARFAEPHHHGDPRAGALRLLCGTGPRAGAELDRAGPGNVHGSAPPPGRGCSISQFSEKEEAAPGRKAGG